MNAMVALKALTCGAAALAITAILSFSFVHSTAEAPWTGAAVSASWTDGAGAKPRMAKLSIRPRHVLFGQSLPAVLVD